ncbi:MAG: DUF1460 domain-containing protein [Gemmatimonadetes bacterium]|nr:MAG: DUF1460 domain-containing protein [Gemmatimonadota bacterium]
MVEYPDEAPRTGSGAQTARGRGRALRGVGPIRLRRPTAAAGLAALALLVGACAGDAGSAGDAPPEAALAASANDGPVTQPNTDVDWNIVREKVAWAFGERLDTVPIGEAVARIGRTFVGTRYSPHTLEVPGPEGLVVELEELDCVTFVENVLALARFVKQAPPTVLNDDRVFRAFYSGILTNLRYRNGEIAGYPSRLHYFSEWIRHHADRGIVRDLGPELGGVPVTEPIDFMTTHVEAYRQLGENPSFVEAMRAIEADISRHPRYEVPQEEIARIEDRIRDGDIIAAASTVEGLDVAHTGIALRIGERVHLLHAPLVGDSVQISEVPLADRILRIRGQDGILVARPLEPGS